MEPNGSPSGSGALRRFLDEHVGEGHWPGSVAAVGVAGDEPAQIVAAGSAALEPGRVAMLEDTLFDLASLTKGLLTALICLRSQAAGAIDLDAPLDRELPEMRGYAGRTPSITDLLAHRAGLPAWAPLYRLAASREDVPAAIASLPPQPVRPLYSCLGPILAGIALERATAAPLRSLFEQEVAAPLGVVGDALPGPVPEPLRARTASTERGRVREAQLAGGAGRGDDIAPGPAVVLRGEVHDGNAAFLGGIAGNAGLFATARATYRLAAACVVPGLLLEAGDLARLSRPLACGEADVRTFGFQSAEAPDAPAGRFGRGSFGHTGFTGTSVWIDPESLRVAVLLTNRLHPRWTEAPMRQWRSDFHSIAAGLARPHRIA